MIEDSIWQNFGAETQDAIKSAFMLLAQSGVLQSQVQLEFQRLAEGDATQSVEEVAKEILRVRADTRGLQLVHDYGLQLTQESEQG